MCSKCGEILYVPADVESKLIKRVIELEEKLEHFMSREDKEIDGPVLEPGKTLDQYVEGVEKNLIERALIETRYNKTKAAELLGISFRSFRYKLEKHGID